jgi:hypothetical protein
MLHDKVPPITGQPDEGVTVVEPKFTVADVSELEKPEPVTVSIVPGGPDDEEMEMSFKTVNCAGGLVSPELPSTVNCFEPPGMDGTAMVHEKLPPVTGQPDEGVTLVEPSVRAIDVSESENKVPVTVTKVPGGPDDVDRDMVGPSTEKIITFPSPELACTISGL